MPLYGITPFVNQSTGEISNLLPEFTQMSLKPGIGALWFSKYYSDVYPSDQVIVRGRPMKPPKYYDKLLARDPRAGVILVPGAFEYTYEEIIDTRIQKAELKLDDCTPERLAVREQIALDTLSKLKRKLV